MSQFPIDNTAGSLVEAVNYLLSGPSGLGQNFQGVSAVGLDADTSADLFLIPVQTWYTGLPFFGPLSFRTSEESPGTQDDPADPGDPDVYYPIWNTLPGGLAVTSITPVTATGRDITVTVTLGSLTNESAAPWTNGQVVVITDATPISYNGTYTVVDYDISSLAVPYDTVTLRSDISQTWAAYTSGAVVKINDTFTQYKEQRFLTGLQSVVSVTGPTDRVFISSQSGSLGVYTYTKFVDVASYTPKVKLQINRYRAVAKTTRPDSADGKYYQGYEWKFDKSIVDLSKIISWDAIGSEVKVNNFGDIIYNNVIDNPGIGLYLYAFQISQYAERDIAPSDGAILIVGAKTTGVRSFTAQAIKR
jgi:hypothetical protein